MLPSPSLSPCNLLSLRRTREALKATINFCLVLSKTSISHLNPFLPAKKHPFKSFNCQLLQSLLWKKVGEKVYYVRWLYGKRQKYVGNERVLLPAPMKELGRGERKKRKCRSLVCLLLAVIGAPHTHLQLLFYGWFFPRKDAIFLCSFISCMHA